MYNDTDPLDKVTVTCTDNDKVFEGHILRQGKDTIRVAIEGTPLNFQKYNNKGLWIANYQGMEFTFLLQ